MRGVRVYDRGGRLLSAERSIQAVCERYGVTRYAVCRQLDKAQGWCGERGCAYTFEARKMR